MGLPCRLTGWLLVKQRALDWCRDGDPVTAKELVDPHAEPTEDMVIVGSILADLAAMDAA